MFPEVIRQKAWTFTPDEVHPFVVRVKDIDNQEWSNNTAFVFENPRTSLHQESTAKISVGGKEMEALVVTSEERGPSKWEVVAGINRIYDPLVILALFYTKWNQTFRDHLANELGLINLEPGPQGETKTGTLRHLMTKGTPYTFDGAEGGSAKNEFPLKIERLQEDPRTKTISFDLSAYAENSKGSQRFTFTQRQLAQSFITSQYEVCDFHHISGMPLRLPRYMKIRAWLKEAQCVLGYDFEALNFRSALKIKPNLPLCYVHLWSLIANDIHTPDLLRVKILIRFYDKVLKSYFTTEEKNVIESAVFTRMRGLISQGPDLEKDFIPDDDCNEMVKLVSAGSISSFFKNKDSTRSHLESLYENFIKSACNSTETYVLLKSLYYVVIASPDNELQEKAYLEKYADQIQSALDYYETNLERKRAELKTESQSLKGTRICEITTDAAKSMLSMHQSPYAWDQVFNACKSHVAFNNFAQGYEIPSEKGFRVVALAYVSQSHYTVTYALPNGKTDSFKIKESPELKKLLHDETKRSFNLPFAQRIERENIASNDAIQALFSERHTALWANPHHLTVLKEQLLKRLSPNELFLTDKEKTHLIINSLMACVLTDPKLIGPVAEIFNIILDKGKDCYFLTENEFLEILTQYNIHGVDRQEVFRRKASLCVTLHHMGRLAIDEVAFVSKENLKQILDEKDPEKDFSMDVDKHCRIVQRDFIRKNLMTEYSQYNGVELSPRFIFYFCLNEKFDGHDSTLSLFKKIGSELVGSAGKEAYTILISGILFHALARLHLEYSPGLPLVTLADRIISDNNLSLTSGTKTEFYDLLKQLESVSLEREVLPEFMKLDLFERLKRLIANKINESIKPDELKIELLEELSQIKRSPLESQNLNEYLKDSFFECMRILREQVPDDPLFENFQAEFNRRPLDRPNRKKRRRREIVFTTVFKKADPVLIDEPPQPSLLIRTASAMSDLASGAISITSDFVTSHYRNLRETVVSPVSSVTTSAVTSPVAATISQVFSTSLEPVHEGGPSMLRINSQPTPSVVPLDIPFNHKNTNEDEFNSLVTGFERPPIFDELNLIKLEFSEVEARLHNVTQRLNIPNDTLAAKLEGLNQLLSRIQSDQGAVEGTLKSSFWRLRNINNLIVNGGHATKLFDNREASDLRQKIQNTNIPVAEIRESAQIIQDATVTLKEHLNVLEKKVTHAEGELKVNTQQALQQRRAHIKENARVMIRELETYEAKLYADFERQCHPKITAKIIAHHVFEPRGGVQALDPGKALQFATVYHAASRLRLALSQLVKNPHPLPDLTQKRKALQSVVDAKKSAYEQQTWFNFPKKLKMRADLRDAEEKVRPYLVITPPTREEIEYNSLKWYNPLNWYRIYTLYNELSIQKKSKKFETKSDEYLKAQFNQLQLTVQSNQTKSTPEVKSLLWTATELREIGERSYVMDLPSSEDETACLELCEAEMERFRTARFRPDHTVAMQNFFNHYDDVKNSVKNPLDELQRTAIADLMSDVYVPPPVQEQRKPVGRTAMRTYQAAVPNSRAAGQLSQFFNDGEPHDKSHALAGTFSSSRNTK